MLDRYVPDPKPPLNYSSPFTILVSVLLSAQCTDERVNRVTPALFALAATPEAMSRMEVENVQRIIRTCGLSATKAKAIVRLSQILVEKFAGNVPKTLEELQSLPGVGRKTASVVLTQAFSLPAFPVDTHIFRLSHRWHLSEGKTSEAVERDLCLLFPKNLWGKIHLQMILYARGYCPARRHSIEMCPICFSCQKSV